MVSEKSEHLLARHAFIHEFGFKPVEGETEITRFQRGWERTIVANHLASLWRLITRLECEIQQRDPPQWMREREPSVATGRKALSEQCKRLKARMESAEALARVFNLHPDRRATSA